MIAVGFSRGTDLKSRLIRWITNADFDHVWIQYSSEIWGSDMVVHAISQGVLIEPFDKTLNDYYTLFELNYDIREGLYFMRNSIGAEYDFFSVIWNSILLVLFRYTQFKFLRRLAARDNYRFSCSEFVAMALKLAGFPGSWDMDTELTHVGDLYNLLSNSDHTTRILELVENGK